MKTTITRRFPAWGSPTKGGRLTVPMLGLYSVAFLGWALSALADPPDPKISRTWHQAYVVQRDEAAGLLTLRTPYYTIEQDLKQGGAITRIALTHGRASNLLVQPLETRVRPARSVERRNPVAGQRRDRRARAPVETAR